MPSSDTCPLTPLRHKFPNRAAAWTAVRGARGTGDSFRVYKCQCGYWHWQRLVSLAAIRREGPTTVAAMAG